MQRLILIPLLVAFVAALAWAQEGDEETGPATMVDETVVEDAATEAEAEPDELPEPQPEFDDTGLDEQGFADEDDDFDPTEEIPADQSIEFPTDI